MIEPSSPNYLKEQHKCFALLNAAVKRRQPWEDTFDEAFRYTLPNRESFYSSTPGTKTTEDIYDETAVHGLQEFASRLQSGLVPNFQKWVDLEAGRMIDENTRKQINAQLEEVSEFIYELIQDSNFSTEAHESFLDLGVSTGCMAVWEGNALQPFVFRSIPMTRLYFCDGPDGKPGPIFYRRTMTKEHIPYSWPGLKIDQELKDEIKEDPHTEVDLFYGVIRDYSKPHEEWEEVIFMPKGQRVLKTRKLVGDGSCPLIVFRWSVAAHEVWGRGPVISSLSGIQTTNLTLQMILDNASMSIAGMWQTDDDGILNADTIELVAGALIPRRRGSDGLQPLQTPGNFNVADIILQDQRNNIRRGLHADMLGNDGKTPVSATEVVDQRAEEGRRMGSAFGRLQSEFVVPVIKRIIFILRGRGLIQLPEVSSGKIMIRSNSPLSQAQMQQDVSNWLNFYQIIAQVLGPQVAQAGLNQEQILGDLQEKFNVPSRHVRSAGEFQQLMGALQQQIQQQGMEAELPPADMGRTA